MANIKSYPNNQDVYIGAEEVMKWHHGRTSGVFAANNNAAVTAVQGSMAVQISDGNGWITDNGGDGIVWWNDNEKTNGAKLQLTVDAAHSTLNRIDRVIVEWKTTNYVDYPEIKILKGTASGAAEAPALTNNSTLRQLSLARISIPAGTTALTASMITDERLDSSVCGLVAEQVNIDTTTMQEQFLSLLWQMETELDELKGQVEQAASGSLIDGSVTAPKIADGAVSTVYTATLNTTWSGSAAPYTKAQTISGILASDKPIIDLVPSATFTDAEAQEEAWANVYRAVTSANTITFYAKEKPTVSIPIQVRCIRK